MTMREQVACRRTELAAELAAGQEMLAEIDGRRAELQQTMLRISGALQVLDELLASEGGGGGEDEDEGGDEGGGGGESRSAGRVHPLLAPA